MNDEFQRASITENVKLWANEFLGESFSFREYQLDSISKIIENILEDKKTSVAELPCGAGKSYIALCVAGTLAKFYDKKTYILVSDTALFKQYESDVKKFGLPFGTISGKDNYICGRNGNTFTSGVCQMNKVSLSSLLDIKKGNTSINVDSEEEDDDDKFYLNYSCKHKCKYIQEYKNALKADVVIMTYQLWLVSTFLMKGSIADQTGITFKQKDLLICDEAHKLSDIVQSFFAPVFNTDKIGYIDDLLWMLELSDTDTSVLPKVSDFVKTFDTMKTVYKSNDYTKNQLLFDLFKRYKSQLQRYEVVINNIKISLRKDSFSTLVDAFQEVSDSVYELNTDICRADIYLKIINNLGVSSFVPSLVSDKEFRFCCANEAELIKQTFHEKTKAEFLMSATIGNFDCYLELIGASDDLSKVSAFEVPSTFDFTKSPIYVSHKYRMSYKEKDTSIPFIIELIKDICSKHSKEHGIIHTGSYAISKAIYDKLPKDIKYRIIFYDKSNGKKEALDSFKKFPNKILMGPSILEGLSFDDDMSRFCIIAKVPYPPLADNLVKEKMKLFKDWYSYTTINSLIQGIGRSIRSKEDYAITYILDGCFSELYSRNFNLFPQYIKERIRQLD